MAPPVPAAQHLPSHIFTRLGLWQESIESNRAAVMVAREELPATPPAGTHSAIALHAMDYIAFEAAHRSGPQRFIGLYGAARAAALAGEKAKAGAFYTQLVTMCASADSERLELQEARAFLGLGQQ